MFPGWPAWAIAVVAIIVATMIPLGIYAALQFGREKTKG